MAELCRYHLRAVFFSVALLLENPAQKVDLSTAAREQHKSQMKSIAAQYFQKMHMFSAAGGKETRELRAVFSEALPHDHIRFVDLKS
jgi:hypothetical protein